MGDFFQNGVITTFQDLGARDHERYEAHYQKYLDDPKECSVEVRYRTPDGDFRPTREFYAPIFDDSGRLIQTVVVELQRVSDAIQTRREAALLKRAVVREKILASQSNLMLPEESLATIAKNLGALAEEPTRDEQIEFLPSSSLRW